jgi:hypothetical protein
MNHHLTIMKSMTEENLKDFITCPYKFYYEYIEKKKRPLDWRQMVQHVINQVVYSYFQLPIEQRHSAKVLDLVEQYWGKLRPQIFESRIQYYTVTAKITDYLMQNLTTETDTAAPPLFLYEKFQTHIDELDVDLSLTFDVAEWSSSSFVVKKYLVEANAEMLKLYFYLTIVFSEKVFQRIPKRIEVVTLLDGKKHLFYPTPENINEGISYLQLMKHLLGESSRFNGVYNEEECPTCPFQKVCNREMQKGTQTKYLS